MLNMNRRADPPAPMVPVMKRQKITVEDLARAIDRPTNEASLIAHGHLTPRAPERALIADFLGVPEHKIFITKKPL